MTARLAMQENQVRAIIRAAKKEGARVEVKIGSAIVTVYPDAQATGQQPVDAGEDIRL